MVTEHQVKHLRFDDQGQNASDANVKVDEQKTNACIKFSTESGDDRDTKLEGELKADLHNELEKRQSDFARGNA